jgi:hypothetical protein
MKPKTDHLFWLASAIVMLAAGCTSTAPGPSNTQSTTPTIPLAAQPTVTPTPVAPQALASVELPAPSWAPSWRTVVGQAARNADWVIVDGLTPPSGVYIIKWTTHVAGCAGTLSNGSDIWGWGTEDPRLPTTGTALMEISDERPYDASSLASCSPWALDFRPVGAYFGPNSTQVGRLLLRLDALASSWTDVGNETVSPDALSIEQAVLGAAKRDPNLSAAIEHAVALDWYRGNNYVLGSRTAEQLRRLAILAEVAQPLLSDKQFDALYGPMASYVDPLTLGLPVQR